MKPPRLAPGALALGVALTALGCLEAPPPLTPQQFETLIADTRDADATTTFDTHDTIEPDADGADADDTDDADDTPDAPDTDTADSDTVDTDTADTADTDTADTDTNDTDTADTDTSDTDAVDSETVDDCTTPDQIVACLPAARALTLFEPDRDGAGMGAPLGFVDAAREGESTWARRDEPLEIALASGQGHDPALRAWFPFDGALDDMVPGGFDLVDGPPDGPKWMAAQPELGEAVELGPRFGGETTAPRAASFTLMAWFVLNAPPDTAAYDLMGYEPARDADPELAIGLDRRQWSALVAGERTTFGAARDGWQHVALTWDGDSGLAILYLDGAVARVLTPALDVASTRFFFGAGFPEPGTPHDLGAAPGGDDLVVLARALDPAEVRAHAQSRLPFGARLVPEAQADLDDLRVVGGDDVVVPSEIIGRRPHGDAGAEVDHVLGVWRFDDDTLEAAWLADGMGRTASGIPLGEEPGPFGATDGAVRASDPGPARLGEGRSVRFGSALTIEFWIRLAASEADTACASDDDGALLATTQVDVADPSVGWVLRFCEGRPELTTSLAQVAGARSLADDAWHHVMVGWGVDHHFVIVDGDVEATAASSGAPDDDGRAIALFHRPPPQSGGGDPPRVIDAAVSDLVIHDVERGAGYARNRAFPRVPHVRVLVDTGAPSGGTHALPELTLRAGSAALGAPFINACGSLVSSCTGYKAWWRFDRPGARALDSAAEALDLDAVGAPEVVPGLDGGLALALASGRFLQRDPAPELGLTEWTVEVGVRTSTTSVEQVLVERPAGAPPDIAVNYALALGAGGTVRHLFALGTGDTVHLATSSAPVEVDLWAAIGGAYDAAPAMLTVANDGVVSGIETDDAPIVDLTRGPLFIGKNGNPDEAQPFVGALDALRIMTVPLEADALLKYPPLAWRPR